MAIMTRLLYLNPAILNLSSHKASKTQRSIPTFRYNYLTNFVANKSKNVNSKINRILLFLVPYFSVSVKKKQENDERFMGCGFPALIQHVEIEGFQVN